MPTSLARVEQQFFRTLNALVEPAVRHGVGSLSLAPASLIVLETTGYKSGQRRRTPLWSVGLGGYRMVSTARADRSFWVRNLQCDPFVSFYLGGRRRDARALVITGGEVIRDSGDLPAPLESFAYTLADVALPGWAFALLVPAKR